MHAHDRTLLSSLGFSDPDKKSPLHDLACRYLALPESRLKIAGLFHQDLRLGVSEDPANFENAICKGVGQYKTIVGFIDLVVHFVNRSRCPGIQCCSSAREFHSQPVSLGVEVKITPVSVGEMLRQINLYRSYKPEYAWLVATAFPVASDNVAILRNERIHHVRLGDAFQVWAEEQQTEAANVSDSPEI